MFAVLKLAGEQTAMLCRGGPRGVPGQLQLPGQTVVACADQSADALQAAVRALGGRAIRLNVSGAFHSPFMADAARRMRAALEGAPFAPAKIALYANLTARPYVRGAEADTLSAQISSPVRWQETIENMLADGAGLFVEAGPGTTLAGLIAKIDPAAQTVSVGGLSGLGALRGRLS